MTIDDDAALARAMRFLLGRCWKTTSVSVVTAAAMIIHEMPQYFPSAVVDLSAVLFGLGLIGMGRLAKDHDKTGTGKE